MREAKVKLQFLNKPESNQSTTFADFYFVPKKGDLVTFPGSSKTYLVKNIIKHISDEETDLTLVLE